MRKPPIKKICFLIIVLCIAARILFHSEVSGWRNQPASANEESKSLQIGASITDEDTQNYETLIAVTISGGGMRAASFGYGVLQALKNVEFVSDDRQTTLLNEIDLISGVSGGSVLAAYFALYGNGTFDQFKERFLYQNIHHQIFQKLVANFWRLTSPNYGRSDVMAELFNQLFGNKNYSDLPNAPRLLISATDLATSRDFQFSADQFDLICSDLSSTPIGFAVAASSAAPLLLSPLTLSNYNARNECTNQLAGNTEANGQVSKRLTRLYEDKTSYEKDNARPFIHLVDGAVSDNLGIRPLVDRVLTVGSVRAAVKSAPANSIKRIVFIVVNAEKNSPQVMDKASEVPNTFSVIDALRYGKGTIESNTTLDLLETAAKNWQTEMQRSVSGPNPFAKDSKLYVIKVNLKDLPEGPDKQHLMHTPTNLSLPRSDVDLLINAGANVLHSSRTFQDLILSLH